MNRSVYEIISFMTDDQARNIVRMLMAPDTEREAIMDGMAKAELVLAQELLRAELAERGVTV